VKRADADDSSGLLFILGFPRSGTTLLGEILAGRPGVALLVEKPLLARAVAELFDPADGPARLAALADAAAQRYREDFWQRVRAGGIATQGRLAVEQTAFNTVYLPLILRLFPEARIVFALRDPRDVVFSCFRRQFAPNRFTLELQSLEGAAQLYCDAMQLAETCRARLGFAPFEIRNEDLIADFDRETQRLCAFAGLSWDESVRDYYRASTDRTLTTVSAVQVRRGIAGDGVGQWRRYREQMAPVLPLLAPWAAKFGYPPE
jgi:hypothetical protein